MLNVDSDKYLICPSLQKEEYTNSIAKRRGKKEEKKKNQKVEVIKLEDLSGGVVACTCNTSYLGGGEMSNLKRGQKYETISEKQIKAKRARGTVQVVQCLPRKYKALSLKKTNSAAKRRTILNSHK
jgi:hypothetical protein